MKSNLQLSTCNNHANSSELGELSTKKGSRSERSEAERIGTERIGTEISGAERPGRCNRAIACHPSVIKPSLPPKLPTFGPEGNPANNIDVLEQVREMIKNLMSLLQSLMSFIGRGDLKSDTGSCGPVPEVKPEPCPKPITVEPSPQAQTPATEPAPVPASEPSVPACGDGITAEIETAPEIGAGEDPVITSERDLATVMKEDLRLGRKGMINEERLQHGLVYHNLLSRNDGSAETYLKAFRAGRKNGNLSVEAAVKFGLRATVQSSQLTKAEARELNGNTFRAAQLDKNHEALYDGRGETSAKMDFDKAIAKALSVLTKIESGDLNVKSRSLSAPENTEGISGEVGASGPSNLNGEFLWKPQSDHGNQLVVLLPSQYTGEVSSVNVIAPDGSSTSLRGTGVANGGREHFRSDKPGSAFTDGSIVEVTLKSGERFRVTIEETSQRKAL